MSVSNKPIVNLASMPIFGLEVSRASATTLEIATGTCRDSSNKLDMTVGTAYPNLQSKTVAAPLTLNAAVNGANGLDTGSLAASKVYAVYVIADSTGYQNVAGLISLSLTAPTMPENYNAMRLVGYALTDGSSNFLLMYQVGSGNEREVLMDVKIATAITAGASTTYAAATLTTMVPAIANVFAHIDCAFTPASAGNLLSLQKFGGTGAQFEQKGQVNAVVIETDCYIPVGLDTATPKINYKVGNGSDAVAINVRGFKYWV
jgi:hypothetical protein